MMRAPVMPPSPAIPRSTTRPPPASSSPALLPKPTSAPRPPAGRVTARDEALSLATGPATATLSEPKPELTFAEVADLPAAAALPAALTFGESALPALLSKLPADGDASGPVVVRSTRAPRAQRVRSQEWVAAVQDATAQADPPPPPAEPPTAAAMGPRGVLVLAEAPLRAALDAAAADGAPTPLALEDLPATVDRHSWCLHAAALFPQLYDPEWHGCLFDFLFEMWLEVGKATAVASGDPGRRLLLTTDAELAAVVAEATGQPLDARLAPAAAAAPQPQPPTGDRRRRAGAFVEAAYGFVERCAASPDFAVRSALAVSVLDCMDDHDLLLGQMAARLPAPLVQRVVTPLVGRFQPEWVVEEWRDAMAEAHPGYQLVATVPRRWAELMDRLADAQVRTRVGVVACFLAV
ncbi:hypothetical protein GPECTOR_4g892 [Gonium pectorale]|uniref:Uncharacterized protein n=1 Tax=Gonium pectorale TaxID=33097 RepID=A0A150GYB3_GONPE|nr:hypothetical protein GPECTOR_4g892 [Gonium pectorale]|eukprot:KXZ54821.1 hypothetical protein GPECTOR_4g892 [Gonium pectorale]